MLWIGLIALAVAVALGFAARAAKKRIRALVTVETLPVGEVKQLHQAAVQAAGPGVFRQPCEIAGAARAHRDGLLRSELEQAECVWHRHRITRKYEEEYTDSDGNRRTRTRSQVVSSHSSPTAFYVEDATGRMVVRPGTHEIDGAEQILDTFEPHRGGGSRLSFGPVSINLGNHSGTLGFRQEEWIVRAGTRLFVHGEASDSGDTLALAAPAEGGVFIMSTKNQEQLLRGENHKVLGFAIAAGVLALAGVVLVVLGALG